jgi:DNA-binding transcriptional LysR family regulator
MGPKFDLRDLRAFLAVADEEHLGRAADRLNISASPLSRHIIDLEARLGLALFEHTRKRLRLTTEGRQFCHQARSLVDHAADVERAVAAAGRGEAGTIAIGYPSGSIGSGFLPGLLRRLRAKAPRVAPRLHPVRSHEGSEMLLRGLLDIALVHTLPDDASEMASVLVQEDPFVLVVPAGHHLLDEPPTALALGGENWIALDNARSPRFRARLIATCSAYGFVPNIQHEAPDLLSVLGLVEAGLGVAFLQSAIRRIAPPGVALVVLPNFKLTVPLHLLWRPTNVSKPAQRFIELAREENDIQRLKARTMPV